MARSIYGGSSADFVARAVELRPGTTVLALAPGVILDVRRADTNALVTDVQPAPGYTGVAFPTGKARSDATGAVAFTGPDGLTTTLDVRAAAVPGAPAGPWVTLTGQPALALAASPPSTTGLVTTTDLASRGYQTAPQVDARVQALVGAAPAALDTLAELATALGDDADFAANVTTALAARVEKSTYAGDLAAVRTAIAQLVTRADAAETALADALRRVADLEQAEPVPPDTGDAFTDIFSDAF